ncbi:Snf7-domain-containing protein [Hysterangium stoloniferum]|nr:Snf7-domain-containing protein [Hysterangium stoloniferum]
MSASSNKPLTSYPTYKSVSSSRLKSLYSDFSLQKQSNPAGFQSNLDWWRRTILHLLSTSGQPSSQDILVLHAESSLIDGLRCEELGVGRPLGIASVITELAASGVIMALTAFQTSGQSIYYSGSLPARLASYLVGRPLWWALEQLSVVGESSRESEENRWKRVQGDYVVVPLLEQAADTVTKHYRATPNLSLADSLYNMDTFRSEFASKALPNVTLSSTDVKVLIKFLERDRKVIVTEKDVLKFIDGDDEEETAKIVTQIDHGVLEMKLAINKLQSQIEDIQQQIEGRAAKIVEHLKRKRKEIALSYLRSRKQLEDLLSKRLRSLETIQATLLRVESAAGDIEIMKAYETSTTTLKSLLAHPSLRRDKIDETMEAMAEAAADHVEIDEAIRLGGEGVSAAGGTTIDDEELKQELQQMIDEREQEEAEAREKEALEKAYKEKEHREREERERVEQIVRERLEEEERERKRLLVESGRMTPVSEEEDKLWEERWRAAQAEKVAQAERDRQAERRRRAQWEDQEAQKAQLE